MIGKEGDIMKKVASVEQEDRTPTMDEGEKSKTNETCDMAYEDLIHEAIEIFSAQKKEDEWRLKLREQNTQCKRDVGDCTPSAIGKREKSVAKVQKIVSRLRRFVDADRDSVILELHKLDVTMHLSEVSDALCDGPVKHKDVGSIVEICSLLLQQYDTEFSSSICSSIIRAFRSTNAVNIALASKRRSLLRLLVELILVQVIPNVTPFLNIIKSLCDAPLPTIPSTTSTSRSVGNSSNDAKRLVSPVYEAQLHVIVHNIGTVEFVVRKFNSAILGTASNKQKTLEAALGRSASRQCAFHENVCASLRTTLIEFYQGPCHDVIIRSYIALVEQINANQTRRINKGVVDAESEGRYNLALTRYTRLRTFLESLSDYLAVDPFTFVEELYNGNPDDSGGHPITRFLPSDAYKSTAGNGIAPTTALIQNDNTQNVWEDDTEKDFYTNLLNLADAMPLCLLGVKQQSTQAPNAGGSLDTDANAPSAVAVDGVPSLASSSTVPPNDCTKNNVSCTAGHGTSSLSSLKTSSLRSASPLTDGGHGAISVWEAKQEHKFLVLDQFVSNLCRATLASEVDTLAIQFFYEQLSVGKAVRRRLTMLLMGTHRNDLHVLPSIARFLATIAPFCKDVLLILTEGIERKFKEFMAVKDPLKLAFLIKSARFLGELCKFRLVPSGVVLDAINELLGDFSQNNIETACHLVQCCGRFLIAEPGVGNRFKNIVQKMMKVKNNRNLPIHLELMVEDSYFQLFPSERLAKPPKQLPLCRQFIQWLLYEKLHNTESEPGSDCPGKKSSKIAAVVMSLRRLNWDDPLIPYWIQNAILKSPSHVAFPCVGNIAHLLCSLVPGYPQFVINCVDNLFESVQLSLEQNNYKETPQRIRTMKLIGELFNFRLIDSSVVLQTLYQLIQFSGSTSYGCHTLDALERLALATENHHLLGNPKEKYNDAATTGPSAFSPPTKTSHKSPSTTRCVPFSSDTTPPCAYPLVNSLAPEDPVDDYFRLKLVCTLLNVCGQYFGKGSNREKMDRFLLCFQRYIRFKNPVPVLIYHDVLDTFERLRPHVNWDMTLQEIDTKLYDMMQKESALRELNVNNNQEDRDECDDRSIDPESMDDQSIVGEVLDCSIDTELDDDPAHTYTEQQSDGSVDLTEDSDCKASVDSIMSERALDDDDDDEDDDDNPEGVQQEKTVEELQAQMFDMELSRIIVRSLQEAKPSFNSLGHRGRVDALLEDIRLPPMSKIDKTTEPAVDRFRVRLVTRKAHNTNKISIKLVDIPKQSRLCQAVLTRETEDAQEHERLKRFVIDSVARHQKQELYDRQNEIRNKMFSTSSRFRGSAPHYTTSRRRTSTFHGKPSIV